MARTINDIQQQILSNMASNATLAPLLTSISSTAIYRLYAYILAVSIWTLETLYDLHKADVNETIAAMKPHTLQWYAGKSKQFQFGYSLPADTDLYDNTGVPEATVLASKIVSNAAVTEQTRGLRIKVAKTSGSNLDALTTTELAAFKTYMQRIKDAGVKLNITTGPADSLQLGLTIKYDALVLSANGERIDGATLTPVKDAIKTYLKNLPFNGVLSIQKLVDALQATEGVKDLRIDVASAKYGALPFTSINIDYTPDAGYLTIADADLTINYIAA